MPKHTTASHTIRIAVPVARCQRFFTPAGEELWVEGWEPSYLHPVDGRTEAGMVFTTGSGADFTIWSLVDYTTGPEHFARYSRVTPATRCGFVEVRCTAEGPAATRIDVGYTLTALTAEGERVLAEFEGDAFVAMIEGWRQRIEARLPALLAADIR